MSAPNGERRLAVLIGADIVPPWSGEIELLDRAATEYDRATAERVTELEVQNDVLLGTIEPFNDCALADKAELETLRERLAKLETAGLFAYEMLIGSSVCESPCDCVDCQIVDKLEEVLDLPEEDP
jgi:hypothetical protein